MAARIADHSFGHSRFLLAQDRDDLLLFEPRPLHRPPPQVGRTLLKIGGTSGAQVTVVLGGKYVADVQRWEKNIREPDERLAMRIASHGIFSILFSDDVYERFMLISHHYKAHPGEQPTADGVKALLEERGMSMPYYEMVLTNPLIRGYIVQTAVFIAFVIYGVSRSPGLA